MTAAATSTDTQTHSTDSAHKQDWQNPDEYRMSIGEHLEELRWRMILGLIGFVIAGAFCLWFGDKVVAYFCRPLLVTLVSRGLPPWTVDRELGGSFMVYIQISLITAGAIAAPWMVYQLWLFVAAGLYPHERKYITRYAPLSIALLVGGMLFVYFIVLPWTIQFFVDWTSSMPMPNIGSNSVLTTLPAPPLNVPVYDGDPVISTLHNGDVWFNTLQSKLNIIVNGSVRSISFVPESLVVPQYELQDYINLVVMMLVMFGLAFQLPLIVMAVLVIGIFDVQQLKSARKVVYFVLLIAAAIITPGDVITATIALMGPLILLYEMGIFLGWRSIKRREAAEAAEAASK